MKANSLTRTLLLLLVAAALPLPAQQTLTDRQRFDAIKASADHGDVEAQLRLASLYATGEGVARDPKKAAAWHRKAADQGSARGQCLLGLDYADGLGVKKDLAEAVRWLRKAADQGLAGACYDLGLIYANGDIQGKSASDAVPLYRKAAEKGLPEAQAALGSCYLEGAGAPKDIPEGVKWTEIAANQGNVNAQRVLGICYSKGKGVPKDNVQAYKWLNLAAAQDNPNTDDTKVNLSMVERFMTPEQIAEGQRLAHDFKPTPPISPGDTTAAVGGSNTPPSTIATPSPSSKTGLVNVRADDESLEIFVDGAFVGNTPAKLKLTEGQHVIEVKKAGFKDYRREVKIHEDSELTLRVMLEKQ